VWRFLRVFKPAHSKVDDFREGRTRQPDDDFLRDCGFESGTEAADIALAVRRAVAGVGLVDPLFVRCDDSYPGTLEVLPLWDSMDWLALASELERELGHSVQWQPGELLRHSQFLTVGDLIAHVRGVLEQVQTAAQAHRSEPADGLVSDGQSSPPAT
jgi:acyl carrier protein